MDEQHISIKQHENGVYEFVTLTNSRATIDAMFDALTAAMDGFPANQTFRYLIDASKNEMPPFAYFIERNRAWVEANPDIAPSKAVLLLPKTNPFRSLIHSLAPVIVRGAKSPFDISIFAPEERDNAIFWLLAD